MPSASSRAFLEFLVQPLADKRAAQAGHASAVVAPACIRCRINCRGAPYGYSYGKGRLVPKTRGSSIASYWSVF